MLKPISFVLTRETIFRAGLIWAAEYGVLALIEDSSHLLKAATVVCALAGLAILETKDILRQRHITIFWSLIILVSTIYVGFCGYALNQYLIQIDNRKHLRIFYIELGTLIHREISANNGAIDKEAVQKLDLDAKKWEEKTSEWIQHNLGLVAEAKFQDISSELPGQWYTKGGIPDQQYSFIITRLVGERKNLATLIETTAYEN